MSPPDDLLEAALEERDYYRAIAEQVGRKVLSDFSDLSRLITTLKRTETLLRSSGDELERKVEERTHAVMHANAELRAEVIERARAESSARESEEMYRLLAETSPDSITVVDLSSAIIMLNQQALHLYGIPADPESTTEPKPDAPIDLDSLGLGAVVRATVGAHRCLWVKTPDDGLSWVSDVSDDNVDENHWPRAVSGSWA